MLMSAYGGDFLEKEEIMSKLRGIKALLFMASSSTDQIEDQDQAFWFLAEQLADCIDELEDLDNAEER